ncbi:MAG: ATP-binding protein [Cellulosilyticaceae bacterium]
MIKSIKYKITIFVTLIIIAVLSLQIIFNLFFAKSFYIKEKSHALEKAYQYIVKNYSDESVILSDTLTKYEESSNLKILIFDGRGEVLYSTIKGCMPGMQMPFSPFRNKRHGGMTQHMGTPEIRRQMSYRNNEESIALQGMIPHNDKERYIIIETPVAAIEESIVTLTKFTLLMTVISLGVGGIIAYYFAKKFTKPIKEIDQVACNVASLDFTTSTIQYNWDDEIGRLARNINVMSAKLSETINQLQHANQELQKDNDLQKKIDQMRKEFIANVSHELKTPLSLLIGYTEMLKNNISGIDKDFYYEVIIDEANRMNELVKNLLQVANMENKLTQLQLNVVNLTDLTSWIIAKNKILFEEKNIIIQTQFIGYAPVEIDSFYIEQAIKNYLINALFHTEPKGKVTVKIEEEDQNIIFTVLNEGKNIPEDEIDKIWESFYRTDKARTRTDDNNIGLGLYIVRTIINAHKGSYGASNNKQGAVFWFSLTKTSKNLSQNTHKS